MRFQVELFLDLLNFALFHSLQKYKDTSNDYIKMYSRYFLFINNLPHLKIVYDSKIVGQLKMNMFSLVSNCELIFR